MCLKNFPSLSEYTEDNCQELWKTIPTKLYRTLEMLHQETIPNGDYSLNDLERLIKSLITEQCGPGQYVVWGGSWSLIGTGDSAPSDVRVDLVFFPTYMAVSLMTLFWYRYPERAMRLNGFQKALHDGFNFASARELFGHGMEGHEQRIQALRILNMGAVPRYLIEHVDAYPKCRPLYNVLIDCKEEIARRYFQVPKEFLSMHKSLSVLPNKVLWETSSDFIWRPQCSDNTSCIILIEAPYANPPKAEIHTDTIANDLARRRGTACILGRHSRKFYRYTTSQNQENRYVVSQYREILKKILTNAKALDDSGKTTLKILHLIIRGLGDRHGVDIEISTRKGMSCTQGISDWVSTSLKEKLERNRRQWKRFTVQKDQLFHGGSKCLELNKNGEECEEAFTGFGENYNAMEIRISLGTRKSYLDEIIDNIGELIEEYRAGAYQKG